MVCESIPVFNANSTNILESANHSEAQQADSTDLLFLLDRYRENILSPIISDNTWTLGYITQSPSPVSPLRLFHPQRPHFRRIAPTPTYPQRQITPAPTHTQRPHYRRIAPTPTMNTTNGPTISSASEPKKKRQRKARACTRCVAISCRKCNPTACNGRQNPSRCHIVKGRDPLPLTSIFVIDLTDSPTISETSEPVTEKQRELRTCTRCSALSCRNCDPSTCNGRQNPSQCHIVKEPVPLTFMPSYVHTIDTAIDSAISDTSETKKKKQRKARTCIRCVAISCRNCDPAACKGRQFPSKCHIVNPPVSQ
ncbi:hypothetical protein EDC94DRAFT_603059 [Helicostylum pulchrum]|uniref:Zn(2)-C6 fungal-type domain-containing protein n=1 Tax=Helicostylum pulchrum TaxID=562976 RepID=A0ABP9YE98_9FUNG|nr:hypothetical protein EDC94DRAFT_603059 [Helicostylum pulchrum]